MISSVKGPSSRIKTWPTQAISSQSNPDGPFRPSISLPYPCPLKTTTPTCSACFEKAGLPFRSAHRDETHPLIIAGGVTCLLNPAPIAPFIDCFLIGEAEANLPGFMRLFTVTETRDALLTRAAQEIEGIYVPAFYRESYNPGQYVSGIETPQRRSRWSSEEPMSGISPRHRPAAPS